MQGTDEHPRTHRTSQIPPDDDFYGDDFCFLHKHRASLKLVPVFLRFFRHLIDVDCDEVVRDDMLEFSKPEQGYARQQLPLFWDALWNRSVFELAGGRWGENNHERSSG